MAHSAGGREIIISEDEFARVVALKAERDALDMDVRTSRVELDKARIDLLELKTRQKDFVEENKKLGHDLELAQQSNMESEKRLSQIRSEMQFLKQQLEVCESQTSSLKDQIMSRDLQISEKDIQIETLTSDLNAMQLDVLQHQVERSKFQVQMQSCSQLQQKVSRLEDELRLKEQNQLHNEARFCDMQKALLDLEKLLADRGPPSEFPITVQNNPIETYDSTAFLEACSKAELLAAIENIRRQNYSRMKTFYFKAFVLSTIALFLVVFIPSSDQEIKFEWYLGSGVLSWLSMVMSKFDLFRM